MKTAKDVLKAIKDNDVKYVDLRFTDPRGKWQHVTFDQGLVDEDALTAWGWARELLKCAPQSRLRISVRHHANAIGRRGRRSHDGAGIEREGGGASQARRNSTNAHDRPVIFVPGPLWQPAAPRRSRARSQAPAR